MKTKTIRFMMLIAILFSLLSPATPAAAQAETASSKGISPAGMLNSDGTLNLAEGFNGALDLSGYRVEIDPVRGPVFGAERSGVFPSTLTVAAWDGLGSSGGMLNGNVIAIAVNGTDVYMGGAFTNANGIAAADYIVKWNSATDTWSALSSNGVGNGSLNGTVNSIVIQGDGSIYVGGEFTNINNNGASLTAADYIARWNGVNWFSVSGNGFSNGSLNDYVNVMTFDDSGNLYVGGGFFNVNNAGNVLNAADYVAKWNGAQWSALGSNGAGDGSLNASVIALETIGNDLYVGGVFFDVNNASTVLYSADRIAKWDGNNWSPLNRNGAGNGSINGWVMALAVSGTDLYVGGTFTDVDDNGNILSAADYVAKWDGTQWSALGSDGSGNGTLNDIVYTLAVDEQGILYAGGEFIDIAIGGFNLNTADYIAKWNGTGWSALGNNGSGNGSLNNHVIDLAVSGTAIYAGGEFINVTSNGVVMPEADYIAGYGLPGTGTDLTPPQVLSVNRGGANPANAANVNFTVTFSKPVSGVNLTAPFNDFSLTTTGVLGAAISAVSGSGSSYNVTVNTGVGNGTVRLNVVDNNSIVDASANQLGGAAVGDGDFTTGEVYTVTKSVGSGADTTGVFRPSNGLLYLKHANATGFADVAINYGTAGDYPVAGDWDGNGTVTIGIYRGGSFYLRNSNTVGFADLVFAFGQPGDQPVAGDWNGDGIDTIGVYRNGLFLLRNSNLAGAADTTFTLGNPGDVGIAGDWNGDGMDTTGVFRPSNGVIFLKNTNTSGFADVALNYGLSGDMPVTGDWNNDGVDTIGVYRNAQFYLRNSNTNGFADLVFALGNPGDMPIAGDWNGLP